MNVWLEMWYSRPYVTVDGTQMLTAAAVSHAYVFVSRAIFRRRKMIVTVLAIPTIVSVASHVGLDCVLTRPLT